MERGSWFSHEPYKQQSMLWIGPGKILDGQKVLYRDFIMTPIEDLVLDVLLAMK